MRREFCNFLIQTRLDPNWLADVLAEILGEKLPSSAINITSDEEIERIGLNWKTIIIQKKVLVITVMEVRHHDQEYYRNLFHFTPDINLYFTVPKPLPGLEEREELGHEHMYQTIAWLLTNFPKSDAVFLVDEGTIPVLWRRQGELLISRYCHEKHFIRDEDLVYMNLPYTFSDDFPVKSLRSLR